MTHTYTKFFVARPTFYAIAVSDNIEIKKWLERNVNMSNTSPINDKLIYLSTRDAYELADCFESPELPELADFVTTIKEKIKRVYHLYFMFD